MHRVQAVRAVVLIRAAGPLHSHTAHGHSVATYHLDGIAGSVFHGEVFHHEVVAGGENADRAEFWNRIEAHHKRGDAVLAREVEVSLPTELEKDQRQALAVGYARELADRYGVAADVALHAPRTVTDRELEKNPDQYHETDPETGRRHNGNWHAHIMLSACHVQPDGTLGKKAVELDPIHCQRAKIENMADRERARWGELANAALERHGHEARIDHRSHAERGIEAEPSQHLGPQAHGYERRTGQPSDKRIQQEREAVERLARAKALGELERQSRQSDRLILDLSGDLSAAKAERDRQPAPEVKQAAASGAADFRAQFEAAKLAEAGKQQARQAFEQFKAEQERQRQAELARQQAAERAAQELAKQREDAERKQQAERAPKPKIDRGGPSLG